jgi:hypothetical protein
MHACMHACTRTHARTLTPTGVAINPASQPASQPARQSAIIIIIIIMVKTYGHGHYVRYTQLSVMYSTGIEMRRMRDGLLSRCGYYSLLHVQFGEYLPLNIMIE